MDKLTELASRHLGKSGDGSVVKAYVTPKEHDKSLLVALPRSLNRKKSKVKDPGIGYEVWHAYEMSFLGESGMPITGVLKVIYPSTSKAMVESKSLKLYLNSFDLEKFKCKEEVEGVIKQDLTEVLGTDSVEVKLHVANEIEFEENPFSIFKKYNVDDLPVIIETYKEDPSILDEKTDTPFRELFFYTANLRSNCEITNQKDTGASFIYLKGERIPSKEALLKYIISFRDTQHFHENLTEIVFNELSKQYSPDILFIGNLYNRRGGISIDSIRYSEKIRIGVINAITRLYNKVDVLFEKIVQQ